MNSKKLKIVFTTLGIYQTEFFYLVGEKLELLGFEVSYICFHEKSHHFLTGKGKKSFNVYQHVLPERPPFNLKDYGIDSLHLYLAYERVGSGKSSTQLNSKFINYIEIVNDILINKIGEGKILLVQEYGGAISLVASFFAARRNNIDNIFIEPSFFRGRFSLVHNNFAANKINPDSAGSISDDVLGYLTKTISEQKIVIPLKDSKQYRSPINKIVDSKNLKRLISKLHGKYVLKNNEEWDYIGRYVVSHVKMLFNNLRFKKYYKPKVDGKFFYFPFHVPNDAALTIRSPEFVDQYALVDYVARIMPVGYTLAIKEHPALIGAIDYERVSKMLNCYNNLVLLDPNTNNYEVLRTAVAVITINSKSGAEALLLGKPVIVLGDAFYKFAPGAIYVDSLSKLPELLNSLFSKTFRAEKNALDHFFQNVWDKTYKGELYKDREENINDFTSSIIQWTKEFVK